MIRRTLALLAWCLGVGLISVAAWAQPAETSCTACHQDPDLFDPEQIEIISQVEQDVHSGAGLSCHDCHGGDPDLALAEDMDAAMDPEFADNPYRAAPQPGDVPSFCGRCHSDPTFMRRYQPDARVDQEQEYWTSQHGMSLTAGDSRVATCVSCHGVHGILGPAESTSMVHPTRVAETCRSCHADPDLMESSTLANGSRFPIDQYARWRQSVHANAMFEKEDLTAPTCNDCHGNHGATPPGLDSVSFVCGQCHGREAELFRNSPKQAAFETHNEFLQEVGADGCAGCHGAPEPAAALTDFRHFGECTSCHGNHGIVRPTIGMLSAPPPTPCAICHEIPTGSSAEIDEPAVILENYAATRDVFLADAAAEGLEGKVLFNWLIDQALALPNHSAIAGDSGEAVMRPEFSRLWAKFRLGKTTYTYEDPVTGEPVEADVIRCDTCHAEEPLVTDEAKGVMASREILTGMNELTSLTAKAERVLLRARRGGVETREALLEIDQAVDAQIELEVLVHDFSALQEDDFAAKKSEGIMHANAALEAGQEALDELSFRRRGLLISLAIIVLVLIALGLKIRHLPGSSS